METKLFYKLDDFEGPLDLLLQLISRNKLNIRDIKLSVLIDQYLEQIEYFRIGTITCAYLYTVCFTKLKYSQKCSNKL